MNSPSARSLLPLSWRTAIAAMVLLAAHAAEEEWRTWTSSAGTAIEAKLVSQDELQATLEKRDGKQITVKRSQLSSGDQEYLDGLAAPAGDAAIAGLAATPGTPSAEIPCQADPQWSYFLYLPRSFHNGASWPVCFVMDPGGGSAGTLTRYLPAADRLGIILAVSCQSKNGFADSERAMMAMVNDVYGRAPILRPLSFASGMSGGSRMAYLLAEKEPSIAGVLACASGSGVYPNADRAEFRQADLRRSTLVCSLIGSNDFNRREAVASHKRFGKDARLLWFRGNHDWANETLIEEGLAYLYGKALAESKDRALDPLRTSFAQQQFAWAKQQQEEAPWVTHFWANFLKGFPTSGSIPREAGALAAELQKHETVARALDAQKAIDSFADKYFSDGSTAADKTPDPARAKDAEKRAAAFEGLPHAGILISMGGPAT